MLRLTAELLLTFADRFVSKRRNRVVIGSNNGANFTGSARDLYNYLLRTGRAQVYVVTRSPDLIHELNRAHPGSAVSGFSWGALRLGLTAGALCMTHTRSDLGLLKYLRGPRFVYLNHGIPLKAMGYEKRYYDPFVARQASSFRAITCCSEFEAEHWRRAYHLPAGRTWVTGAARNDRLTTSRPEIATRLGVVPASRIVLFAPTFRETGVLRGYLPAPDTDTHQLLAVLKRHDATLLVRTHPMDAEAANEWIASVGSPRLVSADTSTLEDLHDLLPLVDVLVTDYSSVYLDFLLLNRPMIFACHDLQDYERQRGFMMDYDAHTPGEHVRSGAAFLAALDAELAGQDPHAGDRGRLRHQLHAHIDDRSCARITDHLLGEA